MSNIIQNAIYIPALDRYLISRHIHDYQEARLPDDSTVSIDGGLDHLSRNGNISQAVEMSLSDEDSDETVYQRLLWGTRGVLGNEPLKWIRVADMEPGHAIAVLAAYGRRLSRYYTRAIGKAAGIEDDDGSFERRLLGIE